MNAKKIVLGLSAVVAVAALAACSSGSTGGSTAQLAAAAATNTSTTTSSSAPAPTTTAPPVTTTTTVVPPPVKTTAPAVKPVAEVAPGIPCTVTVSACVSISQQKAWLVSDGKVVFGPVSVKTGRKGYPTPVGVFHVQYKQKLHISKEFNNTPMPNSVFFYPGVAFHEGPLSVSSHGCVHLSASNSLHFYETLEVGQTVQVVR